MTTHCMFDVDGVIFPNAIEGPFTEFENDPWIDRIPHRVLALPNLHWLTSWLSRANELIHPAPVVCPEAMNPNNRVGVKDRLDNGVWWKAQGLLEHLNQHQEVTRVVWVDDEINDFRDSVELVLQSFPNTKFFLVIPNFREGLNEEDMIRIEMFSNQSVP